MRYTVFRYTLGYHPPFKERSGLLLNLGQGWGEIAPFPGRSKETLQEAEKQLLDVLEKKQLLEPLFPSVAFGLFSALNPLTTPRCLPVCALLAGSMDEILKKAEEAVRMGFQCAKVKISGLDIKEICALVQRLRPLFSLRLDANRAFSFQEAQQLMSTLRPFEIEYIEEPTYELDALEDLSSPFAIDESYLELSALPKNPQLTTIVFKPSILGKVQDSHLKKNIVFSSACETGVGILGIAALAIQTSSPCALGIDTYRYLQQDVLSPPLDFKKGSLTVPTRFTVNTQLLQEIAHG